MQELIDWASACIQQRTAVQHIMASAELIVKLQQNAALRDIVNACPIITASDRAVMIASRLLGIPVPAYISQAELVHNLLTLANQRRYRIFLVGGDPETLQRVEIYIRLFYPYVQVSGILPSWIHPHEETDAWRKVASSGADMLFVSLPSPIREYWLHSRMDQLNVPLCVGSDRAFAQYAAFTRQAPSWMQGTVLERWTARLRRNRINTRALRSYPAFVISMLRGWRHHRKEQSIRMRKED